MTTSDIVRFAAHALSQQKRRSLLSLLGVVIGVVAVVTLTALGEGARRYVTDQFASLGSNLLVMSPGKNETTGVFPGLGGAANDLTLEDAKALERHLREVVRVVPVAATTGAVAHRERSRQVMVIGTTHDFKQIRQLNLWRGSFLPDEDIDRGAPVAVLGRKVASELFGERNPVGQPIRVADNRMRVIGVTTSRGTQMGLNLDESVIVPVATAMRMANRSSLTRLMIEARPGADLARVEREAIALMIERHDDEEDVTVVTQEAVLGSLSSILDMLTLVVAGIAAISLGVAGIGIMNVMLVSVSERTAEVGLMKALGATGRQILLVFLFEAVLLSIAGGAIGLAVGWLLVELGTALYPAVPASPPLWAIWAVVGVSFGTGTLFGVLPATRASRLDPIEALHGG